MFAMILTSLTAVTLVLLLGVLFCSNEAAARAATRVATGDVAVATGGVATGGVATGGVATGGVATGSVATGDESAGKMLQPKQNNSRLGSTLLEVVVVVFDII